jgi:hypothetical protein
MYRDTEATKRKPNGQPSPLLPLQHTSYILLQSPSRVIHANIGSDKNVVTLPSDRHFGLVGRQQWNWGEIHKDTDSGKPSAASSPPTTALHSLASVQVLNFDLVCWEHYLKATALPECWHRCEKSVSRLTMRDAGACITQLCQKYSTYHTWTDLNLRHLASMVDLRFSEFCDEYYCFLWCDTTQSGTSSLMFQWNILLRSLGSKTRPNKQWAAHSLLAYCSRWLLCDPENVVHCSKMLVNFIRIHSITFQKIVVFI